jgi:hypothetical protein
LKFSTRSRDSAGSLQNLFDFKVTTTMSTRYPPKQSLPHLACAYFYDTTRPNRYPAMVTTDPALCSDGDGLANRYEYPFDLNPADSALLNPITMPLKAKTGTLRHQRREKALTTLTTLTTLTYTVWTSRDLATWTQDNGPTQPPNPAVAEVETVRVKLSVALLTAPQFFVRIQIQ